MNGMTMMGCVIGYNQWEQFTWPCVQSWARLNRDHALVVIDHGSEPEYPKTLAAKVVRVEQQSLARACNVGLLECTGADWVALLNNDIEITGSFNGLLKHLDPMTIYGMEFASIAKVDYLVGYAMLISKQALGKVGMFDPGFRVYGYEDVDYCYRATREGFNLQKIELPLIHYKHGSRGFVPDFEQIRIENQTRFLDKWGLTKGEDEQ